LLVRQIGFFVGVGGFLESGVARTAKKYDDEDLSPVRTACDLQKDVPTLNISRNKLPETSSEIEYSLKNGDFSPESRPLSKPSKVREDEGRG
jgi:hypothetical protein